MYADSENAGRSDVLTDARPSGRRTLANALSDSEFDLGAFAAALFSQQIWCWGQDVCDPRANVFLEFGFRRFPPPRQQKDCASVYRLELSRSTRVLPRGFGVFFGDDDLGGVFVPRCRFRPLLAPQADLTKTPWGVEDLPELRTPTTIEERIAARRLTVRLVEWIRDYEVRVAMTFGRGRRERSMQGWRERQVVSPDEMASAWRWISQHIVEIDLREDPRTA